MVVRADWGMTGECYLPLGILGIQVYIPVLTRHSVTKPWNSGKVVVHEATYCRSGRYGMVARYI